MVGYYGGGASAAGLWRCRGEDSAGSVYAIMRPRLMDVCSSMVLLLLFLNVYYESGWTIV